MVLYVAVELALRVSFECPRLTIKLICDGMQASEILQKNTQKVQQWEQQYKAYQLYLRHEAQMRTISRHNHHHALAADSGVLAKFGRRGAGSGPLLGGSNNAEDPDSLNVTVSSLQDYIENRLPPL
eukprot:gene3484-4376_t